MTTIVRKKHSVDAVKETDGNEASGAPRTKRSRRSAAVGATLKVEPPDVWALEEAEAERRNPEKDQQLFRQACGNVRRIMKEILELKKQKNSSSEVAEKRVQASLLFLTMKKLNRLEKIRNRKVRDATNEAKQKVDTHHLQLQNLLYEVSHLTKEVNKCLDFKSNDEEIELVPMREFYKEAPPEISKPELTKTDAHEQTLARLDWELEQRKRLALECNQAEKQKENVLKEIRLRKESLDALQPCLAAVLQATIPIQDQLGTFRNAKHVQNKVATYLPTPLFILHAQLSAYAYAWGEPIVVTVDGDVEEAKALKNLSDEQEEDSGESDQEESVGEKRYRRKTTDKVTEARRKILRKHPLCVTVIIAAKDDSKLKLDFYYLVSLHLVTVTVDLTKSASDPRIPLRNVLCPSILLDTLFPGDDGRDTPNKANYYQLQRLGMDDFHMYVAELGRPYLWAQRMAGIDFVSELDNIYDGKIATAITPQSVTSCSHMETIVRAIKRRIESRISLQKQLFDLEQGVIPVPAELMPLFPARTVTRFTSWSSVAWDDYRAFPQTERFIDGGSVNESHFLFSVSFERKSAKLNGLVAISPHYPEDAPIFALDVLWKRKQESLVDSHNSVTTLQEMEMEVNFYWEELVSSGTISSSSESSINHPGPRLSNRMWLLTAQVQRLLVCFDVYLETTTAVTAGNAGNLTQNRIELSDDFPTDKIFIGGTKRGRSRRMPFKYVPQSGLFIHR